MTDPERRARFAIPTWFGVAVLAFLATIVVLLVVLVLRGGGASTAKPAISTSSYTEIDDYSGGGTGQTATVVISCGMDGRQIGQALVAAGVVKSVSAYLDAANANQGSTGIAAGTYVLRTHMAADLALAEMLGQKPGLLSTRCSN